MLGLSSRDFNQLNKVIFDINGFVSNIFLLTDKVAIVPKYINKLHKKISCMIKSFIKLGRGKSNCLFSNQIRTLYLLVFLCSFSISSIAQNKVIKVACIGNSITYGSGMKNQLRDAYPYVLGRMLGDGYETRNFGVNGSTLLRNGNKPYWNTDAYPKAKDFNPDIVIIKLGSNDSKPIHKAIWGQFEKDLIDMVDTFRMLPSHPKIYLCYPVPVLGIGNFGITDSILVKVIIPSIKKVVEYKKTEFIDLHTALTGQDSLFPDRVHPIPAGTVLIAKAVFKALTGKEGTNVPQEFPGKKGIWNKHDRYDFLFNEKNAIVVAPSTPAIGNPWIFRPAFFGSFSQADSSLLNKGYFIVYLDLTHLYGSPNAQKIFGGFYDYLLKSYQLSPKVTLEGLSRGGLFVLNWAANNPEKVACIYVDAPVCDIKSWPSKKQSTLWNSFLKEYNITDAQADTLKCSPVDIAEKLAKSGLPILDVCGDSDKSVPFTENTLLLRNKMTAAGGNFRIITKHGVDHHPHSLVDPSPIVNFIQQHQTEYLAKQHMNYRGNLNNSRYIFENKKQGRVAFLGGSITEMKGWHNMVMEQLKQRFPETKFDFIEAGIGSTGTTLGSFRIEKDVLSKGKIDLLFVEAAVNDHTNGFDSLAQIRGMEGEVRHALLSNPDMDIIMLHFIYDPFISIFNQGQTPDVILNHEKVADYYQIPSINLAQEIAERMQSKEFDWKQFGGTHPLQFGHQFYGAAIERLMDKMWSVTYADNKLTPHTIPSKPLNEYSYFKGKLIDPKEAKIKKDWQYQSPWTPTVAGTVRERFRGISVLKTLKPGAELSLDFKGTAIGIYTLPGPDAGIIEYSIDGMKFSKLDLFTKWSSNLYIPWVYTLDAALKDKKHKLTLRMSDEKNEKSKGTACQIFYFVVNGE